MTTPTAKGAGAADAFPEMLLTEDLHAPRLYGAAMWAVTTCALLFIGVLAAIVVYKLHPTHWLYTVLPGGLCVLGILALGTGRSGRRLERIPTHYWLIGLLSLAFLIRLAAVWMIPYAASDDFKVYHDAGVRMSRCWQLGEPKGYRCFFPPGQVFSLGVIYRLFGPDIRAAQTLNVVWATLIVLCVWALGRRLLGERAGRIAALLAAVMPSAVFGCLLIGAEVPETIWLVLALLFYVRWLDQKQQLWSALPMGLCLGIGALIRPTYVLLPIPIGLHMLLSWPRKWRAMLAGVLMVIGVAVMVAPWTARNYARTGGFVLISSNGGGNLYSATHPQAKGDYTEAAWVELFDNCEDDLSLHRVGMKHAMRCIREDPGRIFGRLAARKFGLFWFRDTDVAWWAIELPQSKMPGVSVPLWGRQMGKGASDGFYVACLLAAFVGMVLHSQWLRADRRWMVIPVLAIYFTSIHMVFEAQAKYHYMLMPLLCILAALPVADRRLLARPPSKG